MIFTSESVSSGHPDKVADQISDALLDAALKAGDQTTRVAIETLVTTNLVVLAGEVKNFNLDNSQVDQIVRDTIKKIGYDQEGFSYKNVEIINRLHSQSADIALGTDDFGAGDQGLMFGYATYATKSMMPIPIDLSHRLINEYEKVRKSTVYSYLGPDAKAQVSVEIIENKTVRIDQVVFSAQHKEGFLNATREVLREIITDVCGVLIDQDTVFHLNPTGNFVIGGPDGDAGVTGRKIIVDTYGGWAPHGGGAFSGKDPTKVDRSAAYMARYLAKWLVSKGHAKEALVQLSYAIGVKEPTSVSVQTDQGSDPHLAALLKYEFDLTPKGIINFFDLFNFTEYSRNCVGGHFGAKNVPWEIIR